jgi:hypothetical protein
MRKKQAQETAASAGSWLDTVRTLVSADNTDDPSAPLPKRQRKRRSRLNGDPAQHVAMKRTPQVQHQLQRGKQQVNQQKQHHHHHHDESKPPKQPKTLGKHEATKQITFDGSVLEGGGQVLRLCFSVAGITKQKLLIHSIRGKRSKPGLAAQHLAGVKLANDICKGSLKGAALGSTEVEFCPSNNTQNSTQQLNFQAHIQTAGSIALLAQIAVPILCFCPGHRQDGDTCTSSVSMSGGTRVVSQAWE